MSDTIEMPGNHGGVNWGMTAADPAKGTMYVVSMDIPAILKNERREPPSLWQIPSRAAPAMQGKAVYHVYCERCHGPERTRYRRQTYAGSMVQRSDTRETRVWI
jgi:quinoprotein glucose dehydrogenase